jgi:hypothetical protein
MPLAIDRQGSKTVKPYPLSCPACGYDWLSIAKGPTRCKQCGKSFRVPAHVVREALRDEASSQAEAVTNWTERTVPPIPTPRPAPPRRVSPVEPDENPLADALERVQSIFSTIRSSITPPGVAGSPKNKVPHKTKPVVRQSSSQVTPLSEEATVDRHQMGRPAYALLVPCGCRLGTDNGNVAVVRCPNHGPQSVMSAFSSDTDVRPGAILLAMSVT